MCDLCKSPLSVSRLGFEPRTDGLRVHCSTIELPAHYKSYSNNFPHKWLLLRYNRLVMPGPKPEFDLSDDTEFFKRVRAELKFTTPSGPSNRPSAIEDPIKPADPEIPAITNPLHGDLAGTTICTARRSFDAYLASRELPEAENTSPEHKQRIPYKNPPKHPKNTKPYLFLQLLPVPVVGYPEPMQKIISQIESQRGITEIEKTSVFIGCCILAVRQCHPENPYYDPLPEEIAKEAGYIRDGIKPYQSDAAKRRVLAHSDRLATNSNLQKIVNEVFIPSHQ